jgi:hypothetical protein
MKILFILTLTLILAGPAPAQKEQPLTYEQEAMGVLYGLMQDGLVHLAMEQPNGAMFVEPRLWGRLTHKQKYGLLDLARIYVRRFNELGGNLEYLGVFEMTSHQRLGSIHLLKNRITIDR